MRLLRTTIGLMLYCFGFLAAAKCELVGKNHEAAPLSLERIQREIAGSDRHLWDVYCKESELIKKNNFFLRSNIKTGRSDEPSNAPYAYSRESVSTHNKNPSWYKSSEAERIALAMVSYQLSSGGWAKNIDYAKGSRWDLSSRPSEVSTWTAASIGTFDNGATTQEIRYLMCYFQQNSTHKKEVESAIIKGIHFILAAQYPTGGWPQCWPLVGSYHDQITLNDKAYIRNLELLSAIVTDCPEYISPDLRDQAKLALSRGTACLLAIQVKDPVGVRLGWCQQYDPITLKPGPGRIYEMPALSTLESVSVVDYLMKNRDIVEAGAAIESAISWLERVAIYGFVYREGKLGREIVEDSGAGPLWARFYSLTSSRPVFGDVNGLVFSELSEISQERRNGYRWYTTSPKSVISK